MAANAPGVPGEVTAALAAALHFDMDARAYKKDSFVIAGSLGEVITAMGPHLPHMTEAELIAHMQAETVLAEQVPAADLPALFARFDAAGIVLGVATNDGEAGARAHLAAHGVLERFAFVAGYDSGHGAKPAPGMARAFLAKTGLAPDEVAMGGDSTHDMATGKAAGLFRIAVLTGAADAEDLAPHADVVLPSIADLPTWLKLT